jgi:hypothetical protein
MYTSMLHRLYRRGVSKFFNSIPRNNFVHGVPEGLQFDELNELCLDYIKHPLKDVSYCHLSGWKKSNTYRLLLETEKGDYWSLIYKNALYRQDIIPALNNFPINPGPPEYTIYSKSEGGITKYLPRIFRCREIHAGLHYMYLMQDLNECYRPAGGKRDILCISAELTKMYGIFGDYRFGEDSLILYNRELSARLQAYIIGNLERYVSATNSKTVSAVCRNWQKIAGLFEDKYNYCWLSSMIHGDSNLANILVHRKYGDRIKFIDWEWAGVGLPHQDLASLLKRAKPNVEEDALEIFSKNNRSISIGEHNRLYEICQLERGLIDSAFFANQSANSPGRTKIDIVGYIENSASRVMRAYNKLV